MTEQYYSRAYAEQAALDIIRDAPRRPVAEHVAQLIRRGLTDDDILAAGKELGYEPPIMDQTLAELDVALPYIAQVSDVVADRYAGYQRLHAARDQELQQDYHAIAHPESPARLLPASMPFVRNLHLSHRDGARDFLDSYGMSAAWAASPEDAIVVVDTGFMGNVAKRLKEAIQSLYGLAVAPDKVVAALVCSLSTEVEQLIDVPGTVADMLARLPRMQTLYSPYSNSRYAPSTHPLATSLQNMPRFHGPYIGLEYNPTSQTYAPLMRDAPLTTNVDNMNGHDTTDGWANLTIVNPVAAAVVQARTVRYALQTNNLL